MIQEKESDIDFIQGKRTESFIPGLNRAGNQVVYYFDVEKNGEKRRFTALELFDLILEAHYLAADQTENPNQKIVYFMEAEMIIKRYIRQYPAVEKAHDFSKLFDDLNDTLKLYKAYKEFGMFDINAMKTKPDSMEPEKKPENNNYSLKQIAIAYFVMEKPITQENATEILAKHSLFKSTDKLLQKRIRKVSKLMNLTGNQTTDTKHLKDLEAAKRLVSGMKNEKAESELSRIITEFEKTRA